MYRYRYQVSARDVCDRVGRRDEREVKVGDGLSGPADETGGREVCCEGQGAPDSKPSHLLWRVVGGNVRGWTKAKMIGTVRGKRCH